MVLLLLFLFITNSPKLCISSFIGQIADQDSGETGGTKGQIMIGGLIAIHDFDGENNVNCNTTSISSFGLQRAEAMRYAVEKINNDSNLLPNLTFGIEIRDTCGSETRALDESLQFVIDRVPVCRNESQDNTMFGVVGASTSYITAEVANLLRLFRIPLVSYAATSTGLSDRSKYDFLLRTVPPDKFQSMAMVKFIQEKLKWKSVFVLYSATSYGEHGFEAFIQATHEHKDDETNLCVVDSRKIFAGSSTDNIRELLVELHDKEEGVTGIVCYCEVPDIRNLIHIIDNEIQFKSFRLIGSDNFAIGPKSNQSLIFSLHYSKNDLKDFHENWFNKLKPNTVEYKQNPWFLQYWNTKCNRNDTTCSLCDEVNGIISCPRDDKITYTIDAVYSFAHAVHNALYDEHKGNMTAFLTKENEKSDHFLNHLKNVKFHGVSDEVFFTSNASVIYGSYDISQFDVNGQLTVLGLWKHGNLTMYSWGEEHEEFFGESTCKTQCKSNEKRVLKGRLCCWSCEQCKPGEYLSSLHNCTRCFKGYAPNSDFTGCFALPIKHISSTWKAIIYVLVSLGIFATSYTIRTFLTHNDTPLVRGSGRELTYVLLSGILMLFCVPIVLLVYPGSVPCGIARFTVGFFLCVCYGSLLVKTNRIARIFSGRKDLHFLTPSWQIILTAFVLLPQVLINVIGLLLHNPSSEIDYTIDREYGYIRCSMNTVDVMGAYAYNIFIIVLCTYYAFLTRKVPANFNEARYIGFVLYTSLVIWLAFLPIYFTSTEYRAIFLMIDLIMNAITLLLGLFGIKLYIIVLRPEKNSRSNSKCRSITFVSESCHEDVNGYVHSEDYPKKHSKSVHFEKEITSTSLVSNNSELKALHGQEFMKNEDNRDNIELQTLNKDKSSEDFELSSKDIESPHIDKSSKDLDLSINTVKGMNFLNTYEKNYVNKEIPKKPLNHISNGHVHTHVQLHKTFTL